MSVMSSTSQEAFRVATNVPRQPNSISCTSATCSADGVPQLLGVSVRIRCNAKNLLEGARHTVPGQEHHAMRKHAVNRHLVAGQWGQGLGFSHLLLCGADDQQRPRQLGAGAGVHRDHGVGQPAAASRCLRRRRVAEDDGEGVGRRAGQACQQVPCQCHRLRSIVNASSGEVRMLTPMFRWAPTLTCHSALLNEHTHSQQVQGTMGETLLVID